MVHVCFRATKRSANGKGVEWQATNEPGTHLAQIRIGATLDDAVKTSRRRSPRGERAYRPTVSTLHRLPSVMVIGQGRCALVKGDDQVRAKLFLDVNRDLRRQSLARAVQMGSKGHPFFVDPGELLPGWASRHLGRSREDLGNLAHTVLEC